MKESAGEANMTVITIVLIALVLAIGTPLVRGALHTSSRRTCCTASGGTWNSRSSTCTNGSTVC